MKRIASTYIVVLAVLRLTLASPEGCTTVSPAAMRATAERATAWLARHQRGDGTFLYQSTRRGRDLGQYNDVRHAGVLLALYRAGSRADVAAADRGLRWALDRLRPTSVGGVALASGVEADTGGAALLTSALVERRARTNDHRYDDVLADLGRFLVGMQRADGGFSVSVDVVSGAVDRAGTSRYYPGEALWALARLSTTFGPEHWQRAAVRAAHFIATERDDVEGVVAPPLNDHWAAYGFAELARQRPLEPVVASYARLLYGRFALLIRTESRRDAAPVPAVLGPPRRSAALGTWVEGQAALARLAKIDHRVAGLRTRIRSSARCGTRVLVERQDSNGAWYDSGTTRMDDEQHAISGLLATADLGA
jgi:hypothetical protein